MLPGLIDAHGHVLELGYARNQAELAGTPSLDAALAKVKAYAAAHPDAKWITGSGWNQEIWKLGRFPTAKELDAVVADRPVWLSRVDGHAAWANSAAMKLAGVTKATPDPAGGRIERDADGNPSRRFRRRRHRADQREAARTDRAEQGSPRWTPPWPSWPASASPASATPASTWPPTCSTGNTPTRTSSLRASTP